MSKIVCGLFEETLKADAALQSLMSDGFSRSGIDSFYTPPPGQHGLTPIGGDVQRPPDRNFPCHSHL